MKIALAQINTRLGDLQANLTKHLDYINQAISQNAHLVVFPELSLTGYILQDLVPSVSIRLDEENPTFSTLLQASRAIDIVFGFVEEDRRHRYYIAAAYLSGGGIVHIHHKGYLPTYGLFDEARFFARGDQVRAFDTRLGRLGMLICEDFWHISSPYLLWLDGAEMMVFISASPSHGLSDAPRLETATWVEHIHQTYAGMFTCFVASTNRVGYEDGINFWGGASVHAPDGSLLVSAPDQMEALTFAEIDLNQIRRTRARLPLLRDERPEMVLKELERMIKG